MSRKTRGFDSDMRQRLNERKWLDQQNPRGYKVQGANPDDPSSVGIIPIPQHVYAPAGGVRKLKEMLLEDE